MLSSYGSTRRIGPVRINRFYCHVLILKRMHTIDVVKSLNFEDKLPVLEEVEVKFVESGDGSKLWARKLR